MFEQAELQGTQIGPNGNGTGAAAETAPSSADIGPNHGY